MSHHYNIQPEMRLVAVVFTGTISPEEEVVGFETVVADERLRPDFRFLVDRSRSEMEAATSDVQPMIAMVQKHQKALGTPKIAVIVDAQYDFGMLRMFEMMAEDKVEHNFWVFRTVEEACDWIEVNPDQVEWPAADN